MPVGGGVTAVLVGVPGDGVAVGLGTWVGPAGVGLGVDVDRGVGGCDMVAFRSSGM